MLGSHKTPWCHLHKAAMKVLGKKPLRQAPGLAQALMIGTVFEQKTAKENTRLGGGLSSSPFLLPCEWEDTDTATKDFPGLKITNVTGPSLQWHRRDPSRPEVPFPSCPSWDVLQHPRFHVVALPAKAAWCQHISQTQSWGKNESASDSEGVCEHRVPQEKPLVFPGNCQSYGCSRESLVRAEWWKITIQLTGLITHLGSWLLAEQVDTH